MYTGQKNYKRYATAPLPGLYAALVEDRRDPLRLGRVRIRLPQLHEGLEIQDLPWARPCFNLGAGYDFGSFVVPQVGTMVWVAFEAGDTNSPVYLGSAFGRNSRFDKAFNTIDPYDGKKFKKSRSKWIAKKGELETPQEAFLDNELNPDVDVIFKSQKGATIKVNDSDEGESLEIIDRAGQVLKFSCEFDEEDNDSNQSRRGTFEYGSTPDKAFDAKVKKAEITINTKNGQTIHLYSDGITSEMTLSNGAVTLQLSGDHIYVSKAIEVKEDL